MIIKTSFFRKLTPEIAKVINSSDNKVISKFLFSTFRNVKTIVADSYEKTNSLSFDFDDEKFNADLKYRLFLMLAANKDAKCTAEFIENWIKTVFSKIEGVKFDGIDLVDKLAPASKNDLRCKLLIPDIDSKIYDYFVIAFPATSDAIDMANSGFNNPHKNSDIHKITHRDFKQLDRQKNIMEKNMINFESVFRDIESQNDLICESGAAGHIKNLYENEKLTLGEMRDIFHDVFTGKTVLKEKVDGQNILVTFKDGKFGFARSKNTLKEPMDIEKLGKHFEDNPKVKEAFVTSANNISKALTTLEGADLTKVFQNGKNFANLTIVYPPCQHLMDYGNRCFLQINSVDVFDDKFNKITEDEVAGKWLYGKLKANEALQQEMFEITEPNLLRIKNSISANKALDELSKDFNNLIDGYSLKTTLQDYANERLKRYILNVCNHHNIAVERDCPFIKELADRLNYLSHKRPTKSELCTFAKRSGVNVHSDDYKKAMTCLEESCEQMNDEIMRPIEQIVMKAGILLLKNIMGFTSADPQKTSQSLCCKLEEAVSEFEKDDCKLTADKLKLFKKNLKKINEYQEKYMPAEGVIVKIGNGAGAKTYKICGCFGAINRILNLIQK